MQTVDRNPTSVLAKNSGNVPLQERHRWQRNRVEGRGWPHRPSQIGRSLERLGGER